MSCSASFNRGAIRLLVIILLAALLSTAPPNAAGQQKAVEAPKAGRVQGRVTGPDGKPLGGARVTVVSANRHGFFSNAVADEEGRFVFKSLPAGLYSLSAAKGGYVAPPAPEGAEESSAVRVEDGAEVGGVELRLIRGGVITGKISDEGGEPVVFAHVEAVGAEGPARRPKFQQTTPVLTDDRGVYRVFGLPPGRYLLRANVTRPVGRQQEIATVYYPGVGSPGQAVSVEVSEGAESKDVNLTVKQRREEGGGAITGRVARRDGQPLAQVSLWAYADGPASVRVNATPLEDGSFELRDLPAGLYTVEAITSDPRLVERTRTKVSVSPSATADTALLVEPAGAVSGWFETENGQRLTRAEGLYVNAQGDEVFGQFRATMSPDGRFHIGRLPGGQLHLTTNTGATRYHVLRLVHGGRELPQGRLALAPGEQVRDVRVVVSDEGGSLRGLIRAAGAEGLAPGAWVSAIPVDATRRADFGTIRSARADQRGGFVLEGVAPGEYYLLAYRAARSLPNPLALESWIEARRADVPVVEVKAKSDQNVSLRVVD